MKTWQRYGAGLAALAGFLAQARAQSFPGVPTVAAPAAPAAAGAAGTAGTAAPAAPSANLWSFLCPSQDQKKAFKECLCQSQFGLLVNNTLAPLRLFTGGVVPPCCPGLPTAAELADKGPVGAAAAIKKDEAEAKARIAAVKYLATVSCHYWPEAQDALIQALRKDRNECVRWQAALALGSGCCCTKKTIKALAITVSSSDEDGQPAELSDRVKAAAEAALYHCLDCFTETVPAPEPKKEEKRPEPAPAPAPAPESKPVAGQAMTPGAVPGLLAGAVDVRWAAFSQKVEQQPTAEVVAEARRLLKRPATEAPAPLSNVPPGSHGLVDIIVYAAETSPRPIPVVGPAVPAKTPAPADASLLTSRPKDPEPPTDLYHVLMSQRKARAESKPAVSANPGDPKPAMSEFPPPKVEKTPRVEPAPKPVVKTEPAKVSVQIPASTVVKTEPAKVSVQIPASLVMAPAATPTPAMRPAPAPAPVMPARPMPAPAPSLDLRPMPPTSPVKPASASTYPTLSVAAAKTTPAAVVPSAQELLRTLRESSNPFQKEAAIDKLAVIGWPTNGEVIATLVKFARTDPAATVRVHCIRALTVRNVRTPEVLKTIKDLKADKDPRVQHEADTALARLGGSPAPAAPTLLQPTAGSFPGRSK
jgi:hypothetical protein